MINRYIPLAYQYWNVVEILVEEMERTGNKILIRSKVEDDNNDVQQDLERIWKRNDNNIGVPIMFNFYHGLELFIKGLLEVEGLPLKNESHNLKNLFEKIKINESRYSYSMIEILKDLIYKTPDYNPFFVNNELDVNQYYNGLKYPTSKDGETLFKYYKIRGKENSTLIIYKHLVKSIITLKNEVIVWKKKADSSESQY